MTTSRLRKKAIVLLLLVIVIFLLQASFIWKWMFPVKYEVEIRELSSQYSIDPYLMMAIIRVESKFEPNRTSSKGAIGLMQIMPDTAKWVAESTGMAYSDERDLWEPNTNLAIGAWYIGYLNDRFDRNIYAIAAAYNAGQNKVAEWLYHGTWNGDASGIENIPYGETRHYIQKVVYYHKQYKKIYSNEFESKSSYK